MMTSAIPKLASVKPRSARRTRRPAASLIKVALIPCALNLGGGYSYETKPNLGTLGYLGDETRDAEQMRQTNPISAGQARCTNKANLPRRDLGDAGCGPLYKQSQFQQSAGGAGERNAPNKAKLGQAGIPGGWHVRILLCRTCQTNPIAQGGPPRRCPASRADDAGRSRQTNPISASQARCTNKANLPGRDLGDAGCGPLYKRSQFRQSAGGARERNAPNEAKLGQDGTSGGRCVRQICKTNPVLEEVSSVKCQVGRAGRRALEVFLLRTLHFKLPPPCRRDLLYKQSQFPGPAACTNEPNFDGRLCETNPMKKFEV
jgi:hypothetical protein